MGSDRAGGAPAHGSLGDWILRCCPDGLWVLDAEGRTIFGNERMAQHLGLAPDEILGFSAYDVLDDLDAASLRSHLAETVDVESPRAELALNLRRGSLELPVRISPSPLTDDRGIFRGWLHRVSEHACDRDDSGGVVRLHGAPQDVTETKGSENALAFLSAMGRAANEARTLRDVLLAADALVRPYAQWPAVVISVPGPSRGEAMSHIDLDWEPATDELRQAAHDLAVRAADERGTLQAVGPGGTVLVGGAVVALGRLACVLVSDTRRGTEPSPSDLSVFDQMLALLASVAEREWTAEALAAARDDALRASTAKSEFLATMSHEIRTPLNGVIGLSGLLTSTELTPHQRRLAAGVDQAGRTLVALVNDILDLSKIEAGRLDLEEVDFDPRLVLEQSIGLIADAAREKHLELVVSSAGNVPERVRGDPVRFGQVVTNLAANAVKFTASGEVAVRATCVPSATGAVLRVEVSDTGIGIAPQAEDRLFQPFTQADASTTREYGGTGLGLAISKRIVSAMNGEIGVTSKVGSGSTFWFTVELGAPLDDGPEREAVREEAVAGLRVLLVDDNETNRFILGEKLASWQVGVTVVESAYEALVELETANRRNAPYDIALLDYMMPGADGEQLARVIRAEHRHDCTRLALLSSATEPSNDFLSAAGLDTYLSKPVLPTQLLDTLVALGGRSDLVEARPVVLPDEVEAGTRGRVLVLEDNPVNQLVAEGVLRRIGYEVVMADDGAAGVAAFADDLTGFDAVLMDCQLPVMDGYAATQVIRSLPGGSEIPIVAMTAAAVADERKRCLLAGMDDFLLKPIDARLLEQTLERWIRDAHPRRPAQSCDLVAGSDRGAPLEATPQPQAPPTPIEVLDRHRLHELLESGAADLPLLFRILDRFGSRADEVITMLATAVRLGELDEVGRLAHQLRGSAANVGLVRLATLCEDMELAAANGSMPSPRALIEVEDQIVAGVAQLETFARDTVRAAATDSGSHSSANVVSAHTPS